MMFCAQMYISFYRGHYDSCTGHMGTNKAVVYKGTYGVYYHYASAHLGRRRHYVFQLLQSLFGLDPLNQLKDFNQIVHGHLVSDR